MSSTVETLKAEALQLSAAERARLVERFIASLDIDPEAQEDLREAAKCRYVRLSGNYLRTSAHPKRSLGGGMTGQQGTFY